MEIHLFVQPTHKCFSVPPLHISVSGKATATIEQFPSQYINVSNFSLMHM